MRVMMDMETAEKLKKLKVILVTMLDRKYADELLFHSAKPDVADSFFGDTFTVRVVYEMFGIEREAVEVKYPANWREAVKERFAPTWVKQRWPVRYRVVKLIARELYPTALVPDEVVFALDQAIIEW